MKIDADDMRDLDRYHPVSDYGFREYAILLTRVQVANNHVDIAAVAARVTKFVQGEDHNPVYGETLVNMLMAQGYKVIGALDFNSSTHDAMVVRLITRHISTTVSVWQRTMEGYNTHPPTDEG